MHGTIFCIIDGIVMNSIGIPFNQRPSDEIII
jgi:hypothetical protein